MSRVPLRSPKFTKVEAEVGFTIVWLLVEPAGLEEYDHWYEAPVSALALAMVTEAGAQIARNRFRIRLFDFGELFPSIICLLHQVCPKQRINFGGYQIRIRKIKFRRNYGD